MVLRLKRMRTNLHLFGKSPSKNIHNSLIEKSNQLYNELMEKEIIPEIERESDDE